MINRVAWLKFPNNNNPSTSSTTIARQQSRLCLCTHNRRPLNLLINWPCLLSPAIYYAKPMQPVEEKRLSHGSIHFHICFILNTNPILISRNRSSREDGCTSSVLWGNSGSKQHCTRHLRTAWLTDDNVNGITLAFHARNRSADSAWMSQTGKWMAQLRS